MPLKDAFLEYDRHTHMSARRFVPPSFNDIRHILNVAQIMAISKGVQLIVSKQIGENIYNNKKQ